MKFDYEGRFRKAVEEVGHKDAFRVGVSWRFKKVEVDTWISAQQEAKV
jgi:hypothetical protein